MEPNNNIENQFREKLNNREIKPSENAWDRLDAMLTVADSNNTVEEKKKTKRSFGWMSRSFGIAASFLVFIMIATFFLSQTEELIDVEKSPIVNETIAIPSQEEVIKTENITPREKESTIATTENKSNNTKKSIINQNLINQNQTVVNPQNEVAVHHQPTTDNRQLTTENSQLKSDYANVDELLAAVKKNKTDKLFQDKATVRVNSNDLLSQVDGELELSFRQKVIKSVSKNYQEVKVALSTRNQE
ncbi:hypothetical protein J2X31_000437 [Flavobacterium arsenatis]|uniref:Anti-sigma factor n=1 Tax=Flavobacterium arsenatis TaxID=1484332 RepID=A0ABU1TKH8_9FLAO|nr:hypothetical protein [Flavobacterium arsenatis]MDR6966444.1 hypothetical protein [Flavobacterium arsenatis]